MSANKIAFGGNTAITITYTTLANLSSHQSAAVDNTANLYLDALVTVSFTTGAVASPTTVYVYVAGSIDGTTWPGEGSGHNDGVTGLDAAITLESPTNLRLLGVINTPTASMSYVSSPMSVAQAFGGVMPLKWSIIINNQSGAAFTAGTASYTGVYTTNA